MTEQFGFDLGEGIALRDAGMESAAENRAHVLSMARILVRQAALGRADRTATADDAALGLRKCGYGSDALGNAAGSLFRGAQWKFTGDWLPSRRKTNHAHKNRVWRLV